MVFPCTRNHYDQFRSGGSISAFCFEEDTLLTKIGPLAQNQRLLVRYRYKDLCGSIFVTFGKVYGLPNTLDKGLTLRLFYFDPFVLFCFCIPSWPSDGSISRSVHKWTNMNAFCTCECVDPVYYRYKTIVE